MLSVHCKKHRRGSCAQTGQPWSQGLPHPCCATAGHSFGLYEGEERLAALACRQAGPAAFAVAADAAACNAAAPGIVAAGAAAAGWDIAVVAGVAAGGIAAVAVAVRLVYLVELRLVKSAIAAGQYGPEAKGWQDLPGETTCFLEDTPGPAAHVFTSLAQQNQLVAAPQSSTPAGYSLCRAGSRACARI